MQSYFDVTHTVIPDEIDSQHHVHNLRYLQWTLWAASKHSAATGWDATAAAEQGLGWVVRKHDITFRAAALANDQLVIRTWVDDLDRFASRRKYLICRPADRTVLARAETRWVYVDLRVHKVVEIPSSVRDKIQVSATPPLPWEPAALKGK
ncbi:Acyl-ACP thioesterase [Novipirellula galeiformis]|uniref:Acyl-ACP thioesterase n=1 Tax=Novipirellula galeiformis TaxID=2528004 RepID=A0A5C6CBF7_9BACT|nr:acyl-CoA thioesterase [Novipirellula galeiformis]TWU22093.1 Acyl-ACP thioesterase [Novipirellula galeiformis]